VVGKVSGEAVKISGETILTSVSGNVLTVLQSGAPMVRVSGTVDIVTPTEVKTGLLRIVTAASGGAVLHSGAIKSATVKAVTLSGDIYVGGATNRPYSGFGMVLKDGEAVNLDIDDFSKIYVFATISGDMVSFAGVN